MKYSPFFIIITILIVSSFQQLHAQFQTSNDASYLGNKVYQLTPQQGWRDGAAFYKVRHSLDSFFSVTVHLFFGDDDNGADGIAFVMQQNCLNNGTTGGGMGYQNTQGRSIAVEFDTYQNMGFPANDPVYDHLALQKNGSIDHLSNLAGPYPIYPSNANVEDSSWHKVQINYDPVSQFLSVYVADSLRLMHTINLIDSVFDGQQYVYWGFSSATGGNVARHLVKIDSIDCSQLDKDSVCASTSTVFLPPLGHNLISYNKTGRSSGHYVGTFGNFPPENAFDGNQNNRWLSIVADSQWIEVDLEYPTNIDSIVLNWMNQYASVYKIQYSNDQQNWVDAYTENNGQGGAETIALSITSARYIRLFCLQSAASNGFSLSEMEVWGLEQYVWSPDDGTIDDIYSNQPVFSPSQTTVYTVGVPDKCLGTTYFDYTVYVAPTAQLIADFPDSLCRDIVLDLTDSSYYQQYGSGQYAFWQDSNCTIAILQPDSMTQAGTYYVSYADNSCRDTIQLELQFTNQNTADIGLSITSDYNGVPISCYHAADATIQATNTAQVVQYWWADGQTTATATGLATGWHYLEILDSNWCRNNDSLFIPQPDPIIMDSVDLFNNLCNGDSSGRIEVFINGGVPNYQYQWSMGMNTAIAQQLAAGTYQLLVLDANACPFRDTFTISHPDALQISTSVTDISCDSSSNASIALAVQGGSGGYTYSWNNGATNAYIDNLGPGMYIAIVRDANNCSVFDTTMLTAPLLPQLSAYISADSCYVGTSFNLEVLPDQSSEGVRYWWTASDSSTAIADPFAPFTLVNTTQEGNFSFTVQAMSADSCTDTQTLYLSALGFPQPVIPSAFSPNDDAHNDIFQVVYLPRQFLRMFKVFNRWGNVVYDNATEGAWDGTFKGVVQPHEVYIYLISWQFPGQEAVVKKGQLTLLR